MRKCLISGNYMEWYYIVLIILASFLGIFLIGTIVVNIVLINMFLVRKKEMKENKKQAKDTVIEDLGGDWSKYRKMMNETQTIIDQLEWKEVELKYKKKIRRGYFYENKDSDVLIVFAHGWTSNAMENLSFVGRFALNQKYNILIVNAKGHGNSDGNLFGFAVNDYDALVKWCDYIIRSTNRNYHIFLHGISMGGATVLYCADKVINNLDGIIDDCGFTSPWDEFYHGMLRYVKSRFLVKIALISLDVIARIFLRMNIRLNTKASVEKSRVPIFFIHGDLDDFVPTKMSIENYEASKENGFNNELWISEGCKHGTTSLDKDNEYQESVVAFINKNRRVSYERMD